MVLVLAISAPMLRTLLRTSRPGLQLGRSTLHALATGMFFFSLNFMALAEAVAVFEVAPLLITLLAALVLGERVGPRRWSGVVIGLCGALIIIRPGLEVFQPAALLPFGAAACMAGFQIITRLIGRADAMRTTMIYSGAVGLAATTAMLPWFWQTPSLPDGLLMASFGWLGYLGHLALVYALRQAPASTLAPYNYCGFLWAIAAGASDLCRAAGRPDADRRRRHPRRRDLCLAPRAHVRAQGRGRGAGPMSLGARAAAA